MDTKPISLELQILLFRIRESTHVIMERSYFNWEHAPHDWHQYIFIQMRKWFPESTIRDIRLGILEALVGFPIDSQNDLPRNIIKNLMEVLSDNSRYLTAELCLELQDAVESIPNAAAWTLPTAEPKELAVPNLRGTDPSVAEHGSARSASDPRARQKPT